MVATFALLASVARIDAMAEYREYVAKFASYTVITGAMEGRGGPVSQPTVTLFRVWNGGQFDCYGTDSESHFDGKIGYTYFPLTNMFSKRGGEGAELFAIAFGKSYSAVAVPVPAWEGVEDSKYLGWDVRAFKMGGETHGQFLVRKRDGMPVGFRFFGQQAEYASIFTELHLNKEKAPYTPWKKPEGAKEQITG